MLEYNIPVYLSIQKEKLNIDKYLIAKSAGYPEGTVPEYFLEIIQSEFKNAINKIDIKTGYLIIDKRDFQLNEKGFNISNIFFNTGKIIANQLKGSEGIIIFSASVGTYFDKEIKMAFESGDAVKGLIIDTIGSELVERLGAETELFLKSEFLKMGLNLTNRLSPGYCEWNVSEQQILFGLLPKDFCNITLNEAFMMFPIKSISGVIGYGKDVINKEYACKICGMEYCYKRNLLYS